MRGQRKNRELNAVIDNPFSYSDTNKRYHTYSYYIKKKYGKKAAKIPLDAGFTCPNRDGRCGTGGCRFCSARGSGDTVLMSAHDIRDQFESGLVRARKKWPDALGIAYFQSYSNTYAPLEVLKAKIGPAFSWADASEIAVATRPDCLNEEIISWFRAMSRIKPVWIELGLQSSSDKTMKAMNRGHDTDSVISCVKLLQKAGLPVCLHIINGFPEESERDMMITAELVARLRPDAIKIHMLHIIADSPLGKEYQQAPFNMISMEDYVRIVCNQLEILPPEIIIERLTGDGLSEQLLAPEWTLNKRRTLNAIDRELARRNSWQGCRL